ncbi:MAG: hypothetical protein JSV31_08945 [Desulfobacterales bacterium]|nr:MAG: hypothetical protein JSV31_08945 [Desulfobacterales bacterium]
MNSRPLHLLLFLLFIILILPSDAIANLGEKVSTAKTRTSSKTRTSYYKKSFGAVDPIFQTNKNGVVIMEFWAAPPEMWTKAKAMEFAKLLIPKKLRNEKPKMGLEEGIMEPYTFSDGTMIILQQAGFGKKYIGVEVRSPEYKGPPC